METRLSASSPSSLAAPFCLGTVQVSPLLNRLHSAGRTVPIEPRVMGVLVRLAQTPGEVVLREALIAAAWGEAFVSDEGLTQAVSRLRRALAEAGGPQGAVETIPKVGYRLVAPVSAPASSGDGAVSPVSEPLLAPALPPVSPPARRRRFNPRWAAALVVVVSLSAGAWGVGYGLGRTAERPPRIVMKVRRVKPSTDSLSASIPSLAAGEGVRVRQAIRVADAAKQP